MMSGYSLKHLLILDISNDQNCPNRDILLGKRNEVVDFGAYRDCTMAWTHEEPKMFAEFWSRVGNWEGFSNSLLVFRGRGPETNK